MGRLAIAIGIAAIFPVLAAEAAPSWFVCRDNAVEVHVCNELDLADGSKTVTSRWSAAKGKSYAEAKLTGAVHVLPIKTIGLFLDRSAVLYAEVGRKRFRMREALWEEIPQGGTVYTYAVFDARFALRDVTAFVLETSRGGYVLTQESPLK